MIALEWNALVRVFPALHGDHVRARDASGAELPVQVLDANTDGLPDTLLVLASFAPSEVKQLAIEPLAPAGAPPKRVHVRHVPERDDIAWESDRIAFRTYGQGLWKIEPNTRTSGIDVWTKRTRALVIDRWYAKGAGGYHQDTGEGADFYTVGLSLGTGGTAIWRDSALHRPLNFRTHRIVANGPIRAIAELQYDPWDAGGVRVRETKRIQVDAGQHFFRSQSTYHVEGLPAVTWATGTVKRAGIADTMSRAHRWDWQATWGPVDPRQGGHGDLGTAVLVAEEAVIGMRETGDHFLVLARAQSGAPVAHHVGAGWTASGDFADARAWMAHVDAYARRLAAPIRVTIGG